MSHKKDPLEITGIEQIQLVEPDDYARLQARLHRESARSDRAVSLELEREVCGVRPAKKRPARVPRDVANRCDERRWVLNPYFSIPVALGLVCLFAWDWVRGLVGRVL